MKKLEMIKTIGGVIVSVGVTAVVGNALKLSASEARGLKKLSMTIGAFVLSGMVSENATKYFNNKFDDFTDVISKMKDEENQEENKSKEGA